LKNPYVLRVFVFMYCQSFISRPGKPGN
jgi:hypothetical protein